MKKRLLISMFSAVLLALLLAILSPNKAHAEEPVVQVTSDPAPTSDTSTATATAVTIAAVETKIETAQTTLTNAAETQAATITTTIQANVPNTTTQQAATIATTQEPIATAVAEATVKVQEATTAIQSAETAVSVAETAQAAVESQTAVVAEATTNLNNAQTALDTVTQQVESQTAVVATDTANVAVAQAAVNAQTVVVNTETSELTALQNTPSDSKTYTTEGYVAPEPVDTPTVTTTVLPPMYDAATKISTPFDIKMGDTVYEGQGNNSQIYVTSKATITFGTGDFNWWDFPAGPHISVYGSDFMSAGPGASITVKTTETTLAVDWDLHRFGDNNGPITNVNWTMTVNPTTGEWTGVGTVAGNTTNLYNGPRIGVREASGEAVQPMTNVTNSELTSQIQAQTTVVATETAELNTLVEEKNEAVAVLVADTAVLNTLQAEKTTAEAVVVDKTEIKTAEVATLTQLTETATATVQAADTLANTANTKVNEAVTAMTNAAQVTTNYYAEQRAAQQAASQAAAEAAAQQAAQEAAAAAQSQPRPDRSPAADDAVAARARARH